MTKYSDMTNAELARLCAEKVMGGAIMDPFVWEGGTILQRWIDPNRPAEDVDGHWLISWLPDFCNDARYWMMVVEVMQRSGWDVILEMTKHPPFACTMSMATPSRTSPYKMYEAEATTPGRAVVIAALEAVERE